MSVVSFAQVVGLIVIGIFALLGVIVSVGLVVAAVVVHRGIQHDRARLARPGPQPTPDDDDPSLDGLVVDNPIRLWRAQ